MNLIWDFIFGPIYLFWFSFLKKYFPYITQEIYSFREKVNKTKNNNKCNEYVIEKEKELQR